MRELSSSERHMLSARRAAGLPVHGFADDAEPAADPLALLTDLLSAVAKGDGKKLLADLSKQAADARTLRDLVAKERASFDEHARSETERLAADRAKIDAERREHEAQIARVQAAIGKEARAADAARKEAEKMKAEAEALRAEMRKRVAAVQAAANG